MFFESYGTLRYENNPLKAVVEVSQGLADFYRSLVPRSIRIQRQAFSAHISVVRKQVPPNMDCWGKYEGERIDFVYSPIVRSDEVYYWINTYSRRLEEIRLELGLPVYDSVTAPPDHNQSFHITIGNLKG